MKATVIIEKAKDGFFSCYMENDNFDFGLIGHGATAAEAKADLTAAYGEFVEMRGKEVPELEFEYDKLENVIHEIGRELTAASF